MGPLEWLHKLGTASTAQSACPEDTRCVVVPIRDSERRRKRLAREARKGWVSGLPKSASEALKTAMSWQAEIESTGIRRADIARREGLTRARVTQVMSLLKLPDEMKAMLLDGQGDGNDWSVRRAICAATARRPSRHAT